MTNIKNRMTHYSENESLLPTINEDGETLSVSYSATSVNCADKQQNTYLTYRRRWYILAIFSLCAATQTLLWNTWGPIADTAKDVLGWTDADIALLTIWGGIVFAVAVIPLTSLMDKLGLRVAFIMAETFTLLGVAIRCLPVGVDNLKYTANAGQFLIGMAGPVLMSGPPLLSVVWFPPHQRTTATAVSSTAAGLGVAISFLIGPAVVSEIKVTNMTTLSPATETYSDQNFVLLQDIGPTVKQHHIDEIYELLYIDLGWVAFLNILAWIYFPPKPPTPPSASADMKREDFWEGAKCLVRSQYFWIPALAFSVSLGVFNAWSTQLDTMFKHTVEVGQETVGWIGFYTNIAGVFGGLLAARCVDYLGGQMKWVLIMLMMTAVVTFVWFVLICYKVIAFNMASLFISCITYGLLLNASLPIFYELTVEGMYPVAEGITTGALNWTFNFTGLVFLFVMMIPDIGVFWMNWTVLVMLLFTIPLLLAYKENNKRLSTDINKTNSGAVVESG